MGYNIVDKMQACLDYYRKQTVITDPKEHVDLYEGLPDTVEELVKCVQGLVIHGEESKQYDVSFSTNQGNEELLRTVPQMLARIRKLDGRKLSTPREPAKRLVGMCRDMSVLLASFLRYKNVPARVRAGFASYFESDIKYEDHWICEYWNEEEKRWKRVDSQVDDPHRKKYNINFDTLDVKAENGYYTAGEVYKLCNEGKAKKDDFGYNKWWKGDKSIRGNMLHEFNCLNGIELMPWDLWCDLFTLKQGELKKEDKELFDTISELTIHADSNFGNLEEVFKNLPYDYYRTLTSQMKILGIIEGFKRVDTESLEEKNNSVLEKYKEHKEVEAKVENVNFESALDAAVDEKPGYIVVSGAKQNNLKNISLEIPKNKFIVVTGVSGSGKSTFAFDVLYAEGQRRYMEGYSTYLKAQLGLLEKPNVEKITGLNPPIAIEQKTVGKNPRSTVGTLTDIIDYIRVLYAKIGVFHCPQCGEIIESNSSSQIRKKLMSLKPGVKVDIKAKHHDAMVEIASFEIPAKSDSNYREINSTLLKAIEKGLDAGKGGIQVGLDDTDTISFTDRNICPNCDIKYPKLVSGMFDYNSHEGSCYECNGLGVNLEVDPELVIQHPELSILDGASDWWGALRNKKRTGNWMIGEIYALASYFNVDLNIAWKDLPEEFRHAALFGTGDVEHVYEYESNGRVSQIVRPAVGAVTNILRLFRETKSEESRSSYTKYMREETCHVCKGEKLATEARYVTVGGKRLPEVTAMPLEDLYQWIVGLPGKISDLDFEISKELIGEVKKRLKFMIDVGLHYLTLDRSAPSLSGGEGQRIRLATQLGCSLVGLLYILDEPSIGLHPRDHNSLLKTIMKLRDDGNSVIVVEHDSDTMRAADYIIDIGPGAGVLGGKVMAMGTPEEIMNNDNSLTGKYLSGKLSVCQKDKVRKQPKGWLTIKGAVLNNLKNVTAKIPLGVLTCVTGVSGSGKSSLITRTLAPAMENILKGENRKCGPYDSIEGYEKLEDIIYINQDPIGKSPRSTPATYVEVFDEIRKFYATLPQAKICGYKNNQFSFNSKSGQCKTCEGYGKKKIEMNFMADAWVVCPDCGGKRYNAETLEVEYKGKNIADVLEMDFEEATEFFKDVPKIRHILQTLIDIGLGYLKLGQNSTTLSGGEAQRIKLAKELQKIQTGKTIYILDEPTTGLHFSDISKLLIVLERLTAAGNTVILVEHNTEVISSSDWIIDIGPEGGVAGGHIIAEGTPETVAANEKSYTGKFIKSYLNE